MHRRLASIVVLAFGVIAGANRVTAQNKSPIPDVPAQETARKAASEIYAGRFAQTKTVAEKTALATEIIGAASKVPNGSADQYILLKIAGDMAAGAGDATTAIRAAETLAKQFDASLTKLKAESLLTAASRATVSAQHKVVAELAVTVAADLADADEYEAAIQLCDAAQASAREAKLIPLGKELANKANDLKDKEKAALEYKEAEAVLENNPTEPASNLAAGRYLCFVKNDWEQGVSYLALGGAPELRMAAVLELRKANSAEQQAAIGDAWWAAAETKTGEERDSLRLRAGFWYRKAEPNVQAGLGRLKITERLSEIATLGRDIPTTPPKAAAPKEPPLAIAPFDEETAKERQTAWAKHLGVPVVQTNSVGMRLAIIPPGEFDMGSAADGVVRVPSEAPKHRVRITRPFLLGLCEVTQGEYGRVIGNNPSEFKPRDSNVYRPSDLYRPVESVTWELAVAFCRRLGELPAEKENGRVYRLPTEAEWEYACRAGTTTLYSFGDNPGLLDQYAWWRGNSGSTTHPVGQKKPNAFGLFDLHGNVAEWCNDWQASYSPDLSVDPKGPMNAKERILRGGGFSLQADAYRSAARSDEPPQYSSNGLGFRVVCDRISAPREARVLSASVREGF